MSLLINSNEESLKFYTDRNSNFIILQANSRDSVILENASDEFDGLCDEYDRIHILIQDSLGGLCYIKRERNTWKKYNIFVSKEKKRNISGITLTESNGMLCAFYIIKHNDKHMLIKHIFSSENLHITPTVVDLLDFRKNFCISVAPDNALMLYYRNDAGERCTKIFNTDFSEIHSEKSSETVDVYGQCVVNDGKKLCYLQIRPEKNNTILVFKSSDTPDREKIITYGIARNSRLSINAINDKINIFWEDGNTIMKSSSINGGKDFSKPSYVPSKNKFSKIRLKGIKAGVYNSEYSVSENSSMQPQAPALKKFNNTALQNGGRNVMNNHSFKDIDSFEFVRKLSNIESEISKINYNLDKVCIFLDKLIQFKKDTDNPKHSFNISKPSPSTNDIGIKNEENIRLFENLSIDEALKDSKELHTSPKEENDFEHRT